MALKIGKLFALGGGDDGGPTGIDLTSKEGRIAAMFAEIRAASQQRRITVAVGDAELVMDAGGKQLYRVISVKPTTLRFAKATGIESRSYDNLDNQLIIITQLFAEIAGVQGEFDIVSRPVPTPYPAKLEGFSPDELKFAYERYAPTDTEIAKAASDEAVLNDAPAAGTPKAEAPTPEPAPKAPVPDAPVAAPSRSTEEIDFEPPAAPPSRTTTPPAATDGPLIPEEAVQVETSRLTVEAKRAFHDLVSGYCDVTILMNSAGDILIETRNAPVWSAMSKDIATDVLRWVKNTASVLPQKQLVVMRSQLSHSHSICFFADGEYVTFAVINSVAIGRLFVAANDFVG